MENIQVVDIDLEEMMGTEDVAAALGIDYRDALALMKNQVIPSRRVNGLYTLRSVFQKNRNKLQRKN